MLSVEQLNKLSYKELEGVFYDNGSYNPVAPENSKYSIRVGSKSLFSNDTNDLKDKFIHYVRNYSLISLREEWEKSLTPLAERREDGTLLVILKDKTGKYHCHRYFSIGNDWTVSVDRQETDAEDAMKWSMVPKAKCEYEDN